MKLLNVILSGILLMAALPLDVAAQGATSIEQANKDLMKNVKKKSRAKKVWVETAPDGYWYFKAYDGINYGVYDQQGNDIAPLSDFYSELVYMPALPAGKSKVPRSPRSIDQGDFYLSHPQVKGCFIGRTYRRTDFISLDGTKTQVPNDAMYFTIYPGWVMTNVLFGLDDRYGRSVTNKEISGLCPEGNLVNIYTSDGRLYLENIQSFSIDKDQNLFYTRTVDGVSKRGVKNLDDASFDIPCVYAGIYKDKDTGKWMVNETTNSSSHEFVANQTNNKPQYRDDGERLFEAQDYQGVIEYYSTTGAAAPWAKFFSGMAMAQIAETDLTGKKIYIEKVEAGNWSKLNNPFLRNHYDKNLSVDITTDIELLLGAEQLFLEYLESGDTSYSGQAEAELSGIADYYNNIVPIVQQRFDKAVANHKAHNVAEARKIEEQRLLQQQQSMLIVGMINNIISSIGNSVGGSTSGVSAGSVNSSSVSTAPVASSSSSSASDDNSSRKTFLKGQIIEWKSKLKKAETSYEQAMAGSDESWRKKKVLESKQNTIDECANMIRQYESELNSLK